ncbi:hypothetical protein HPB47_003721 [Ixodes persulcatus]|uniref:Uncharacterized protein n=1 Tax=Ixodes persulcatus TaxID=34615 RepID=A0AC60PIT0_IXOPE|nr:hypothetical protein HPB47_003721 [Ixodes persulcatus]
MVQARQNVVEASGIVPRSLGAAMLPWISLTIGVRVKHVIARRGQADGRATRLVRPSFVLSTAESAKIAAAERHSNLPRRRRWRLTPTPESVAVVGVRHHVRLSALMPSFLVFRADV